MIFTLDAGELPDESEALLVLADRLHVACGGHAGDAGSMRRTLAVARAHGVEVGAHPSYPDRENFGRRSMTLSPEDLRASLETQCRSLVAIATELGMTVRSAKAHGALYHDTLSDPVRADVLIDAVISTLGEVAIVTQPGVLADRATARGLVVLREGFADRGMLPDGRLIPRSEPGALIEDPRIAARQAQVLAVSGAFDTLCVHGDGPNALDIARAVREALRP
jgi:UPF0271 protein